MRIFLKCNTKYFTTEQRVNFKTLLSKVMYKDPRADALFLLEGGTADLFFKHIIHSNVVRPINKTTLARSESSPSGIFKLEFAIITSADIAIIKDFVRLFKSQCPEEEMMAVVYYSKSKDEHKGFSMLGETELDYDNVDGELISCTVSSTNFCKVVLDSNQTIF